MARVACYPCTAATAHGLQASRATRTLPLSGYGFFGAGGVCGFTGCAAGFVGSGLGGGGGGGGLGLIVVMGQMPGISLLQAAQRPDL